MELVVLVVMLALIQYIVFAVQVGKARVKYGVKAPAMSGHVVFERYQRVQMNTLEQLIIFIPAAFSFAFLIDGQGWPGSEIAAFLGVIFLIGRHVYARSYVQDPAKRALGFMMTFVPSVMLLLGAITGVLFTVI